VLNRKRVFSHKVTVAGDGVTLSRKVTLGGDSGVGVPSHSLGTSMSPSPDGSTSTLPVGLSV